MFLINWLFALFSNIYIRFHKNKKINIKHIDQQSNLQEID